MRRFILVRHADVSGVSGTGIVAEGIEFSDGRVATRWLAPVGRPAQTCVWDRISDVEAVHGHGGLTRVHWVDDARVHTDPLPTEPYGTTPLFDSLVNPDPAPPPAAA